MIRMRTIDEFIRMHKKDDPETAITKNALRTMVLSGKIPCVQVGRKRLLNYDQVLEILQNPQQQEENTPEYGMVRRVV